MSKTHQDLVRLEKVRYFDVLQKFQDICVREATIKGMLKTLNSNGSFKGASVEEEFSARSIGVDVLWSTWIQARRSSLLSELSSILAVKDALLHDAQYAMARVQTSEIVSKNSFESTAIKQKKSRSSQLDRLGVIREFGNNVIK